MTTRLTLPTHLHSELHARARAFAHVHARRHRKPPSQKFDFPAELVVTMADVTLYYDPQLGQEGADPAKQVKDTSSRPTSTAATILGWPANR